MDIELVEKFNLETCKKWWLVGYKGHYIGKIFETFHPDFSYEAFTPEPEVRSKRSLTLVEAEQFLTESLKEEK